MWGGGLMLRAVGAGENGVGVVTWLKDGDRV